MGALCVNAARDAHSAPLLCKLIDDCDRSDEERLETSAELLRLEPTMAIAPMERFARTAREDDTPLEIAGLIPSNDWPVALRIAREVAWPANFKTNNEVRLRAVILIGEIDPTQAIPALELLSKDPSVTDDKVKFDAARRIVTEHNGPITTLVKFGFNPERDRIYRVKAAEFVGERDSTTGAQMYISIAKTCTLEDPSRPNFLGKAYKLAPEPATEALAEDAQNGRVPGEIRLKCVKIAKPKLDTQRIIDLYTTIARTTKDDTALTAVRKSERWQGRPVPT
jgi:hypothetical protein